MYAANKVVFREVQRPRSIFIWLCAIVSSVVAIPMWYGFISQVILGHAFGNHPAPNVILTVMWVFAGIFIPYILPSMKLITEVRNDGVYIRFVPWHIRFVRIPIDDIKNHKIIDYDAFSRFGGWGIRYNLEGEKAYNIGASKGIQIDTHSKVVIVGSRTPEELESAIKTIFEGRA